MGASNPVTPSNGPSPYMGRANIPFPRFGNNMPQQGMFQGGMYPGGRMFRGSIPGMTTLPYRPAPFFPGPEMASGGQPQQNWQSQLPYMQSQLQNAYGSTYTPNPSGYGSDRPQTFEEMFRAIT
jgi:hypothetical protein